MIRVHISASIIDNRGVFASVDIKKGELIETAPYLVYTDTINELSDYSFAYKKNKVLLCLGYGCIYNHSAKPNLKYRYSDKLKQSIDFIAIRSIEKNEELFINYGKAWWTSRRVNE